MPSKLPFNALPHVTDPLLIELARSLVLKNPNLNILQPEYAGQYPPLAQLLEQQFQKYHASGKLFLPNLQIWENKSIAIFSDYSGESAGNYYTYSFLVCAMDALGLFQQEMKKVRQIFSLGDKELAFKDFRMGKMCNALPSYLNLLDQYVPGFLFTLVVDKQLSTVFGTPDKATGTTIVQILEKEGIGKRKRQDAEKLLRIVHTMAFLLGLLGYTGQKIFWMTDHDNICANQSLHDQSLHLLQRVIGIYSKANFSLLGGARPFDEKNTDFLDLLSAADLTAGTLEHYLTHRDCMGAENATVRPGADKVLYWLGHDGLSLKKLSVVMRPGQDGSINAGTMEFTPKVYPADAAFVSI